MCIYPGITSTRNFCKFCRAVIPVPGSPVSSVRPCHNTRNFWKFCETFKPVPELLLILLDIHTRTRNFCEFCAPRATIPGVRVQHLLYLPGTSVSYVRPCHNTRNFWKFCNTFIPVPETSGSYVRLPYPYPESTQPTEHNLGISSHCVNSRTLLFLRLRRWKNVFLRVFGDGIRLRKQRLAQGKLSA